MTQLLKRWDSGTCQQEETSTWYLLMNTYRPHQWRVDVFFEERQQSQEACWEPVTCWEGRSISPSGLRWSPAAGLKPSSASPPAWTAAWTEPPSHTDNSIGVGYSFYFWMPAQTCSHYFKISLEFTTDYKRMTRIAQGFLYLLNITPKWSDFLCDIGGNFSDFGMFVSFCFFLFLPKLFVMSHHHSDHLKKIKNKKIKLHITSISTHVKSL